MNEYHWRSQSGPWEQPGWREERLLSHGVPCEHLCLCMFISPQCPLHQHVPESGVHSVFAGWAFPTSERFVFGSESHLCARGALLVASAFSLPPHPFSPSPCAPDFQLLMLQGVLRHPSLSCPCQPDLRSEQELGIPSLPDSSGFHVSCRGNSVQACGQ